MRKSEKRDQHAQRIARNAAAKAKRIRVRKEFERGESQQARRKEQVARMRRAARMGDGLAMLALFGAERPR